MGSRVGIRLFHILHFVMDFLFPVLKNFKATVTRCDLSPRFFCIDATLLCEFESDKIRTNEFE